jgi:tetratricopeptide (TPR) repeat protein
MVRSAISVSPRLVMPLVLVVLAGTAWLTLSASDPSTPSAATTSMAADEEYISPNLLPAPRLLPELPAASRMAMRPASSALRQVAFPAQSAPTESPMILAPATTVGDPPSSTPWPPILPFAPAPTLAPAATPPTILAFDPTPSAPDARELNAEVPEGETSSPWSGPLMTAFQPRERSLRMEEVAREADLHTRAGFDLAGRGAYHSARAEFIQALRLVAQGLDGEHGARTHGESLSAGLAALEEAEDFVPRGSRLEADLDVPGIVAGHRTTILRDASTDGVLPMDAVRRYLTFAQDQCAVAEGGEVAGSMALHAMGKLHAALAARQDSGGRIAEPAAVAFYQASLLVCRQNYMASNDLGVLLARGGRHAEAVAAFEHSLSVQRNSTTWTNLAKVYRQLGDADTAGRAETLAQASLQEEKTRLAGGGAPRANWVGPGEFSESYAKMPDFNRPPPTPRVASSAGSNAAKPAQTQQTEQSWPWSPWDSTRK